MLNSAVPALLAVACFVCFLVGVLTLLAAIEVRRNQLLLWTATSFLVGGVALLIGITAPTPYSALRNIWLVNCLLLFVHASQWYGLRLFFGKRGYWPWLLAGPLVWSVLCLWPEFRASVDARVLAFSLLALGYTIAALYESAPHWKAYKLVTAPVLFFLTEHAVFYLYRMLPRPSLDGSWLGRPDFALTIFELLLFVVGFSFSVLIMVRAYSERHYQHASLHDALTGLANRRALFATGAAMLARARHDGGELGVLLCDLDWFKRINDRHGHEAGDRVLSLFADMLRNTIRPGDLCARLGGEEFVVVAPGLSGTDAPGLAERIRTNLAAIAKQLPRAQTISIGIAGGALDDADLSRLLTRADDALYAAKAAGRNCVRVWSAATPHPGSGGHRIITQMSLDLEH